MKITKSYLKQIIKEELNYVILEQDVELEQLNEINFKSLLAPFLAFAITATASGDVLAKTKPQKITAKSDAYDGKKTKKPEVLKMATDTLRSSGAIGPGDVVIEIIDISTPNRQGAGYNIKAANGQDYGLTRMGPMKQ